jgi:uncharacterized membrane protein YraQ (UPF0718 family)
VNSSATVAPSASQPRAAYLAAGIVLLLTFLAGLFYYKWGGAIRAVGGVHASGASGASADGLTAGGVLRASGFYLQRIWLALAYGILIGAAVRAFVPIRKVIEIIDAGGPTRRQLAGGAAGAPLMLCSCCVTPVFAGIYERGARLGTALTVMLASPGLNPAALLLTFLLFPRDAALARFGATLVVALAVAAGVWLTACLAGLLVRP